MKDKLISYDEIRKIHPIFRGKHGDYLFKLIMKISGLDHVNEIYDKSKHLTGPAFAKMYWINWEYNASYEMWKCWINIMTSHLLPFPTTLMGTSTALQP